MGGVTGGAAGDEEKPWHVIRPELLEDVRAALCAYPTLHLFVNDNGVEIRGTFPVLGTNGEVLDEYRVVIALTAAYPRALPVVRETGGRIPWTLDRHVLSGSGTCCVVLPDARWEEFPEGAPFRDYLAGPLRNYFLGQGIVERGGKWPFGEWGHGNKGPLEYYGQLFGTQDPAAIRRFLELIGWPNEHTRPRCACGSGKRLSKCCLAKVTDLRSKLSRRTVRGAFARLGFHRAGHFAPRRARSR